MVYSLTYRRPSHVQQSRNSVCSQGKNSISDYASLTSGQSGNSTGIPQALSFDRIVSGGTCPPCTTRDFMNYLIYIEHAAENLQFFLWYRDYVKRFEGLPKTEQALAPPWTGDHPDPDMSQVMSNPKEQLSPETIAAFKGTAFASPVTSVSEIKNNPFGTPPHTPRTEHGSVQVVSPMSFDDASTLRADSSVGFHTGSHLKVAAEAYHTADVKWQPFTIQPFRDEISRIISIYIADGAPRQLNLSAKERAKLLQALASTTSPSAFRQVAQTVEWSLRRQAHPNFIRWTICNGNRSRVIFARGLGIGGILLGLVSIVILTLSHVGRAWRILPAILLMIGVSTLIAAWKGMCVVLHGLHHRHLRPWELFACTDDTSTCGYNMHKHSFDTIESSNSYEDEPWVAKYEKRNLLRKVFDREVWIQEPALRQIQDTIFLQAILAAFLCTTTIVGVFCAIPRGNLF